MPSHTRKASELSGIEVIPFNIPELDEQTGIGGVPTKKIVEIFGPWSIGKSTLGYYLVASAQSMGREVLWCDTENSLTGATEYPRLLGVDLDKFNIMTDHEGAKEKLVGEDYLDELEKWAKEKKNCLLVLDSVGGLHSRREAELNAGETATGVRSKMISLFVRNTKPYLNMNNHCLLILNHQFNPINFGGSGPSQAPQIKAAGGEKLEYHKDMSFLLSEGWPKSEAGNLLKITREDGTKGGRFIKSKMWKNKMANTQWSEAIFALTVGQGVKNDWNLVEKVLSLGIVEKEGNTYLYKGEKICVGRPKLVAWIKEHEEEVKAALA